MTPLKALWMISPRDDALAAQLPVQRALAELEAALATRGVTVRRGGQVSDAATGETALVVSGCDTGAARALLERAAVNLPGRAEALALVPGQADGQPLLLACGRDARGLVYAVLELADRVRHSDRTEDGLALPAPVVETPANAVRSVMRLFSSEVEDRAWFHDRDFWRRYLAMLIAQRFNRFSLTLGLGYNFPRHVTDAYFYFAYPFLLAAPGYEVKAVGLSDEERDRNLETLRCISEETVACGLDFQLGLWTHAHEWQDSPQANYTIAGLNADNHAAYCRDALQRLLEACPAIGGVTFRVHGESGVPEQSYDFWRVVFQGIERCGRTIEIDMHAKGLDQEMIDVALATGMPVNISPKYWAEHMGLPYHQADIRELERPPRDGRSEGFMALSGGARRFLRYGYGDLLKEDRPYGVLHRIWPGTQRLLLWGDPALAAGYGRLAHFCDSLGMEIFEPLSFKGRMGSGLPGSRDGYADASLRPAGGDWEKYLYTYRLIGRLLYNPESDPDVWRRSLRKEFGAAADAVEAALAQASRILPLITVAHHVSASNNAYWPEIHTRIPMVDESRRHPYGDTPSPKRFGTVSPLDPELFLGVEEYAEEIVQEQPSGRISPLQVASWLGMCCTAAERHLEEAQTAVANPDDPAFRRAALDIALQSGLGAFFAHQLRAGVLFALGEKTGEARFLEGALDLAREARDAWARLSQRAEGAYADDLTFGPQPHLRGHWSDRLAALDEDLQDLEARCQEVPAKPAASAEDLASRWPAIRALIELSVHALHHPEATLPWCCDHTPPASFRPGKAVAIEALIPGADQEDDPPGIDLHYRHVNQAERWEAISMARSQDRYQAVIPADYSDSPYPLQYFLVIKGMGRAWLHPGFAPDLANQPYYVVRHQMKT